MDRIIEAANKRGSTAKTRAGAWRYLHSHWPQPLPPHDWEGCPPMGREAWSRWHHDRRLEAAQVVVPLGPQDRDRVVTRAHVLYPRRQNWIGAEARVGTGWSVEKICGRYSSRCRYTRYEYRPTMASWAIIWRDGRRLEYHHDGDTSILDAPHGYYWEQDDNGLRLVSRARGDDDYHPNSDDLRDNYSKRAIRGKLLANARRRAEWRCTRSQIRRAESEGVYVCLADSVRAGNCRLGSERWARRYGLDPRGHYRPSELLRRANGDGARVRLAVVAALRRHHTEMRCGYAVLADHRLA